MMLELDDIQSGILRPRPTPYAATYLLVRIDDPIDGRRLMQRASELVASAASATSPDEDAWVNVGLTFQGLRALGVPQASLDSFPPEFQQGMAARAAVLGDTGESAPAHWEAPLGTPDVHVVFAAIAPDSERLAARIERARRRMIPVWAPTRRATTRSSTVTIRRGTRPLRARTSGARTRATRWGAETRCGSTACSGAAENTASCLGCAPCAGSPRSARDQAHAAQRLMQLAA
ncbi:hypothetical protein WME91_37720 [Sorangium sp. So ce269]